MTQITIPSPLVFHFSSFSPFFWTSLSPPFTSAPDAHAVPFPCSVFALICAENDGDAPKEKEAWLYSLFDDEPLKTAGITKLSGESRCTARQFSQLRVVKFGARDLPIHHAACVFIVSDVCLFHLDAPLPPISSSQAMCLVHRHGWIFYTG